MPTFGAAMAILTRDFDPVPRRPGTLKPRYPGKYGYKVMVDEQAQCLHLENPKGSLVSHDPPGLEYLHEIDLDYRVPLVLRLLREALFAGEQFQEFFNGAIVDARGIEQNPYFK